ncbi:hypothetical protein HY624_04125 [Candidatus Uhrbacteria bacterium]|nr:hypothetical protein [Candidatus Uhrbacteria bacterium]
MHSLGTDGSSVDAMLARADGWTIHEIQEAGITLKKETANGSVIGVVSAKIIPTPYMLSIRDTEALIPRTIEASGGESSKAIIEQRLMRYSDDQRPYMYASFTVKGIPVSSVILPIGKRIVVITGMNLEDRPQIETDIQQMVEPIAVSFDGHESPDVHEFTNAWAMTSDARRAWPDYPIVEFSVPNDWVVEAQNSLQEPVLVFWKARFGRPISLSIDKIHERLAPLPTATLLQRAIDEVRAAAEKGDPQFMYQMQGIRTIGTVDMYELVRDAQIPGGARAGKIEYVVRRGAYLISFSFDADSFADALAVAPQYRAALSTLSISGTPELPDPALSRLDKQQQSIQSGGEDSMIAPQPQLSKMMQTHHGLLEASGAVVAYNTRRLKNQKEEQSLKAELKKKLTERLAIVGKKPAWNAKQWEKFYRQYIYGYYWVEDIFRSLVVSKIIHPTKRAPEWRQESGYQKEFAKISWIQMLDARIPGTKQIKGNDRDGDGLPDLFEKNIGTDPKKKDTDGDGYSDGEEVRAGHNPLQPAAKKKPVVKKKSAVEKTPAKKKK